MDMPSQDICDVATTLFDRHGNLQQHLYGIFASESNEGQLLYIRDVVLVEAYQHQSIGCKAVRLLLQQLNLPSKSSERANWGFAGKQMLLR